jgi:uncharacterized protein DUF222
MKLAEIDLAMATSAELVAAVGAITAELAARPADSVPGPAAKDMAEALLAAVDHAEAVIAPLIRQVEVSGEAQRWGFASTTAWLRSQGMRPYRARERHAVARQLQRLPEVAKRFAAGELSYGYTAVICQAVPRLTDADTAIAEQILLDLAAKAHVGKVAAAGTRIHEMIAQRDDTETDPESARGYTRSWIETSKTLDGGKYIRGYLNAEDAAAWDGLIAPLAKPAGPDDARDTAERTAAALTTALTKGTTGTRALVIINLDTLTGGPTPARLPDGTPIPPEQARRIAASAGVSPLLLGTGNVPLYLGRRVRFATTHQRQVLTALYDTCAIDNCDIPATLCEIDHLNGYALGSPTDIDQLLPLCGWHNRWKHTHPHRIHTTHDPTTGRYTCRILPPPHQQPGDRRLRGGGGVPGRSAARNGAGAGLDSPHPRPSADRCNKPQPTRGQLRQHHSDESSSPKIQRPA